MISLKRIVEQQGSESQYYDLGKDFANFKRMIDGSFEQVKQQYEQTINAKLAGKRVKANASRGYKQYIKTYEFDVVKVTIDDYYDNYVVVAHDNSTPKPKEYFLQPGYKITIVGPATGQPSPQKGGQPMQAKSQTPRAEPMPPAQSQQMTPAPAGNTPSEIKERANVETGQYDAYSMETIAQDIKSWLPRMLLKPETALRDFVKGVGWKTTSRSGLSTALFDLKIPKDALKIKLTPTIIYNVFKNVSKPGESFEATKAEYDDKTEEWNIRVKKTISKTI